jgi:aromatic ring-opening dioxygenase LigB subunit
MAKSTLSTGGLIGVAYLPHGTMLLDPNREDLPHGVKSLHSSCMKISEKIAELNPDLIILLTPHGINLHQAINVYQPGVPNSKASGNAEWNNQWTDYSVKVNLDGETCQDLYLYLKERLSKVEGMLSFAGLSTPLRWGEVVPLYFALHQLAIKTETNNSTLKHISLQSQPKIVIIAQPSKGTTSMIIDLDCILCIAKNFS